MSMKARYIFEHIDSPVDYQYSKIVRESLFDDSYYENQLYESVLNEKFDISQIKNIISKISDKKQALYNLIKKFNDTHNLNTRKYIAGVLVIMYLTNFAINNNKWKQTPQQYIQTVSNELAKEDSIDVDDIIKYIEAAEVNDSFKNPATLTLSDEGKKFIKKHEGLNLKAFKDNYMITIGYGHAEYPEDSQYKIGDMISRETANELFIIDIKEKENDIQRMFRQWEQRGNGVKVTQGMYDALVSMAYNIGIRGLRNTEFIEHVEKGDFLIASERIKTTKVSKEFPGLEKRRKNEYKMFIKDIT